MPDNNNNASNVNTYALPTTGVLTDITFGADSYEIGLGSSTREAIENAFDDISERIDENEEIVSNALNDLEERKADTTDLPVIPTNVSTFTNDAGYLTSTDISGKADKSEMSVTTSGDQTTITLKTGTSATVINAHQDISNYFNDVAYDSSTNRINFKNGNTVKKYIDTTDIFDSDDYYTKDYIDETEKTIALALTDLNDRLNLKVDDTDLATVATTGSYNDLTNKPTVSGDIIENGTNLVTSGAIYNAIVDNERVVASALTYLNETKITVSDIPSNVSDFANDKGYINGAVYDSTNKLLKFNYDGTTMASISTTNIFDPDDYYTKTDIDAADRVVAESLNNLNNIKSDKTLLVNHGTSDTTFTLTPNTKHVWGEVASLTITLGTEISGIVNIFYFQFDSGSTATTLSLPASIKWNYDEQLVVLPNTRYQINIEGGIATVGFATLT